MNDARTRAVILSLSVLGLVSQSSRRAAAGAMNDTVAYQTRADIRSVDGMSSTPVIFQGRDGLLSRNGEVELGSLILKTTIGQPAHTIDSRFSIGLELREPSSSPDAPGLRPPMTLSGSIKGTAGGEYSSLHIQFDPPRDLYGRLWADVYHLSGDGLASVGFANQFGPSPDGLLGLLRLEKLEFELAGPSEYSVKIDLKGDFNAVNIPEASTTFLLGLIFGGAAYRHMVGRSRQHPTISIS